MARSTPTSSNGSVSGHRQRLRERFLAGESEARTEEALLELLLTYAIPQQDVAPLAHTLLATFGNLAGVLAAEPAQLLAVKGIKETSATLLKLVDAIRCSLASTTTTLEEPSVSEAAGEQLSLFEASETAHMTDEQGRATSSTPEASPEKKATAKRVPPPVRPRSELFANASLDDAIEQLPHLPETDSIDAIREFLRGALHYSALGTRKRHADYVVRRMFPSGRADRALPRFARGYAARQELHDACFYRFCAAEPLMLSLTEDLLLPAIGAGYLERERVRTYLSERNPASKSIDDALVAIFKVYSVSGVAQATKTGLRFAYRDILLPSFAFVLHSEFPEPGMYDIAKVEQNRAMRALLWNPDRILPALYELRNRGILSKVSEIDNVRQFTTRMTLEQVVEALAAEGSRA